MKSYVEHANLTVSNLDAAIDFLTTALPDFEVRKRWVIDDKEWAHIGTDTTYLALNTPLDAKSLSPERPDQEHQMYAVGFNHVGFVVGDVSDVRNRLLAASHARGYNAGEIIEHPHRRSVYFLDRDGNEFEFMQYLTEDPALRNSYA